MKPALLAASLFALSPAYWSASADTEINLSVFVPAACQSSVLSSSATDADLFVSCNSDAVLEINTTLGTDADLSWIEFDGNRVPLTENTQFSIAAYPVGRQHKLRVSPQVNLSQISYSVVPTF